jgi:hypothetical protein
VAGRGAFDDTIAIVLIQVLEKHGLKAEPYSIAGASISKSAARTTSIACLSLLDVERSATRVRNSIRYIRRHLSHAKVVVGLWGHDAGEDRAAYTPAGIAADFCAYSLKEGLARLLEAARAEADAA